MRWMEMIRLRTLQSDEKWLPEPLLLSAKNTEDEPGLIQIRLYRNALYQGDFSVTILWETAFPELNGSRLALSLTETLKTFGLVEHSLWIENDFENT